MPGRWKETAAWTLVTALLVAWLARKGIRTYFFAEAFVYLGSYHEAGDSFFGALFRPHGSIFFRPSLWAVNLAWNLIAPPDALLYHLRNVAVIVVNALLLHRLLLRLIPDRFGRGVTMTFHAVSKVHLTTIGYVAAFSTILLLFATLAMLVSFSRWLERRRAPDFVLTLLFALFLIFSKDYGTVGVLLLPLLAWARGEDVIRAMRPFAIPLAVFVLAYAGIRAGVKPAPPQGAYRPQIGARVLARKTVQAATTLGNLSLFETEGRTGARGVTLLVWPDGSRAGRISEGVALLAFCAFGIALLIRARPPWRVVAFGIAWGVLFLVPTLPTANEQVYYHNDLVVAAGLVLGAAASRAWRGATIALLVLLALNAEVSQRSMRYTWYDISESLRPLEVIAERFRQVPLERIVFVASDRARWDFALRAGGAAPFVPVILGRPGLQVVVVDRRAFQGAPNALVVDVDAGFRTTFRASRLQPRHAPVPASPGGNAAPQPHASTASGRP